MGKWGARLAGGSQRMEACAPGLILNMMYVYEWNDIIRFAFLVWGMGQQGVVQLPRCHRYLLLGNSWWWELKNSATFERSLESRINGTALGKKICVKMNCKELCSGFLWFSPFIQSMRKNSSERDNNDFPGSKWRLRTGKTLKDTEPQFVNHIHRTSSQVRVVTWT